MYTYIALLFRFKLADSLCLFIITFLAEFSSRLGSEFILNIGVVPSSVVGSLFYPRKVEVNFRNGCSH